MTNITPTVGRKVWFYKNGTQKEPFDATVIAVSPEEILLMVNEVSGFPGKNPKVFMDVHAVPEILNSGFDANIQGPYATWMPYQIKQAEKAAEPVESSDLPVVGEIWLDYKGREVEVKAVFNGTVSYAYIEFNRELQTSNYDWNMFFTKKVKEEKEKIIPAIGEIWVGQNGEIAEVVLVPEGETVVYKFPKCEYPFKAPIAIWMKYFTKKEKANKPIPQKAEDNTVRTGSVWKHHSGHTYRIMAVANEGAKDPRVYPMTVVYVGTENGKIWTRPLSDWHRSFKKVYG